MGTLVAFAADLASRTDHELLRLFALRPDAITPPVANFADLASRLATTASIDAALDQLSLPQLHTLAGLAHGADPAELESLHELALILRADPLALPIQKYDGGTRLFLPLSAVGLALGSDGGALRVGVGAEVGVGSGDGSAAADAIPLSAFEDLPDAPIPLLTPVSPALRDNAVGSAVETLLRTMGALLDVVGEAGINALRGGAIGVRPVRELSKALDIGVETVHFYLELAAAAQLLSFNETDRGWHTQDQRAHDDLTAAESWRTLERADQWLVLVQSWLGNVRPPSAQIRPLAPYDPPRQARQWRRQLASTLANMGAPATDVKALATSPHVADAAAPDIRTLLEAASWHHPRQAAALGHEIPALLQEMEWLGITGAGAISAPGRAAVNNRPAEATATLRPLLPEPVENFVLQGDLTAIAPGFLATELTATLKLMAVSEGRGAAGIFRFSQHSLEAAASGGMSRSFLLNFLQESSSTAVPQSLEFLIAEVFRNRPDGDLSTESEPRISPDKALAPSPSVAQGWSPQLWELGTGVVHDELEALAQIKRLRSQPVWANDGVGESGPALVMEQLRQALERGRILNVRAVNRDGEIEELLLLPVSLDAGMLRARLATTGRERRLSIHRIISAVAKPRDPETLSPALQPTGADHASTSSGSTTTSQGAS